MCAAFTERRAVMHEVLSAIPDLQVPMPDGSTMPSVDPSQLYYYGNSQGGIMGGVLAGVATDIDRFALGVGGMSYPLLIKRSTAWIQYGAVMRGYVLVPNSLLANTRGRIVVTGVGKSGRVGRKIAATLSSTGSPWLSTP